MTEGLFPRPADTIPHRPSGRAPFTQGGLQVTGALCIRTVGDAGPYGRLTEALFSRPFALKARGNTHRALGGPPKVVEGSFDKPGKG